MLVQAVFSIAGNLISQLGKFVKLVCNANGDRGILEEVAKSLAEALGSLTDAILLTLVAYFTKKRADAFSKTKFAQTVGKTPLMQWLKKRQQSQIMGQKINVDNMIAEYGKEGTEILRRGVIGKAPALLRWIKPLIIRDISENSLHIAIL